MRARLLLVLILVSLALVACRDRDGGDDTAAPTVEATPTAEATPTFEATPAPSAEPTSQPGEEPRPIAAGKHDRSLVVGGSERSYLLHIPPAYDGVTQLPVVLVFHGGGGRAENAVRMTHMDEVADRHGFIAVFPDGTGRLGEFLLTFNAGNCCGHAKNAGVDDVGFARALIEELAASLAVDPRRIYVTGMSNGGMMSYRLACEAADLIAAAAPVAGALNVTPCTPSEPVSLIAFHGTEDTSVLYEGGEPITRADPNSRVDTSVAASVGFFVEHNGCSAAPSSSRSGSIATDRWSGCDGGTAVALYSVEGYGHSWPGGAPGFPGASQPTPDLDASEVMWQFFAAHPKAAP